MFYIIEYDTHTYFFLNSFYSPNLKTVVKNMYFKKIIWLIVFKFGVPTNREWLVLES